jgi:hypothetical protein
VTVWPAIVAVPLRAGPPSLAAVLAATVNVAVPEPVPPPVTVMKAALAVEVHTHPLPVVTVTCEVPPLPPMLTAVGDTAYVQLGAVDVDSPPLQAHVLTRKATLMARSGLFTGISLPGTSR